MLLLNRETLKSYLADYYSNSKVVNEILNAFALLLTELEEDSEEMIKQLQPESATYSLSTWENDYRLVNRDNYNSAFRRNVIIARMKGSGTCTKDLIEQVCSAFSNGEVEVTENTSDYYFTIKFVGTKGIPENMSDLISAIDDIKPAHLGYNFIYTYLVWDTLNNYDISYDSLEWFSWDDLEVDNIHELDIITDENDEVIDEDNNTIVTERIE